MRAPRATRSPLLRSCTVALLLVVAVVAYAQFSLTPDDERRAKLPLRRAWALTRGNVPSRQWPTAAGTRGRGGEAAGEARHLEPHPHGLRGRNHPGPQRRPPVGLSRRLGVRRVLRRDVLVYATLMPGSLQQ
eukprot:TRINITY_DN5362_c0_g1_i4.p1 TRINITY_DN5362_c0_g1~~TRINITY_DN5362_c0_g1_i4.p1  ORF type:complete len:145 (+),score=7.78 TRINITY_DN5362_c0_g1_i4:42-437(+)